MYFRIRDIGNMGERTIVGMKGTRITSIGSSSLKLLKSSHTSGTGAQVPSCIVDGCKSDLRKCRDYHRRHKVCELHSKMPKVTICGQEQRFCQQCSRFHSLVEFDDRKRSCRKCLDRHNRRRRKPQPSSMTLNVESFLYGNRGPRFIPFCNQLLPASNDVSSSWIGTIKPESNVLLCDSNSQLLPGLLACDYEEKQPPISCIPIGLLPKSSDTHPFLDVGSSNVGNAQKVLENGSNRFFDSDCALSLLSTPVEPGEINNLGSMVQSNLIPPAHFIHNHELGLDRDPVNSGLVSGRSTDANIRCYSTFQDEPDGPSIDLFRF